MVDKHNLEPKKLSPEAVRALNRQHWAGNVRALLNVIEQAAVMSEQATITTNDLPFGPAPVPNGSGILVSIPEDRLDLKSALKEVIEQAERIIIQKALKAHDQNRTRAAETLGISRRALINKNTGLRFGVSGGSPIFLNEAHAASFGL